MLGILTNHDAGVLAPCISILCILPLLLIFNHKFQTLHTRPKGCRRLGIPPDQSNIRDEFDPKYTHGVPEGHHDANGLPSWRIKALFAYPIKSCGGVELEVADVVLTGLAYDRQFCFAEYVVPKQQGAKPHWTARTLRDKRFERMALIKPEIWVPDPTAGDYAPDLDEVKSGGVMVISYPRVFSGNALVSFLEKLGIMLGVISREHSFQVPLSPPDYLKSYPSIPVKIWKDTPIAYDYGHHIPQSLRAYLGSDPATPLTLFRVNPSDHREIFRCAPRKEDLGFQTVTGFADAYPIHLLSLSSVRDVAARCAADIPRLSIRRFRANIIIQGPEAFTEDHWKRISVGGVGDGVEIHTVCRTVRCRLPNVDPDTGVRHPSEPDRTLRSYRRIDRGDLMNACLGMQLVPAVQSEFLIIGLGCTVLTDFRVYDFGG